MLGRVGAVDTNADTVKEMARQGNDVRGVVEFADGRLEMLARALSCGDDVGDFCRPCLELVEWQGHSEGTSVNRPP